MSVNITSKYIGADFYGDHYQVVINGKKFPRERGCNYIVTQYWEDKKARAEQLAVAEYEGKYVSRGGQIYEDEEAYHQAMEIQDEMYER